MSREGSMSDTREDDAQAPKKEYLEESDVASRSRSRTRSRSGSRERKSRTRSRSRSRSRSRRSRSRRNSGSRSGRAANNRFATREDPEPSKCLGVFGLSLYTTERDLRELFTQFGELDKVQLVFDHPTGRSRGFAFVYFERQEDATAAKEKMAGAEVDGHRVRVDYSITKRAHTPTPGIYMGTPAQTRGYGGGRRGGGGRYRRSPSPYRGYKGGRYRDSSPMGDYYGGSGSMRSSRYYDDYDRYDSRYDRYSYGGGGYGGGGGGYRRSPSPRYYDDRRRSSRRSRSYDRDRDAY